MGFHWFSSADDPRPGNPDPGHFEITGTISIGDYTIAMITYPDAINYEGRKVLLFRGVTVMQLKRMKEIDPHFTPVSGLVARFQPTDFGVELAIALVKTLTLEARRV